jgi:DNA-3-methyladenine glycosylase
VGARAAGAAVPGALLPREFFARPALDVAAHLLGTVLEHQTPDGLVAVLLTEVEAYEGASDPASHAYRGRTARTGVMFGPPGHAYVYFTYGMHFCVNLVCLPEGTASAVLLRAGRVIEGATLAAARRPAAADARDLARGPARLCQALGITRAQDGADVCDSASGLRVRSAVEAAPGVAGAAGRVAGAVGVAGAGGVAAGAGGVAAGAAVGGAAAGGAAAGGGVAGGGVAGAAGAGVGAVSRGPRVGVSAAGDRPWRFWLTDDPTVSAYRPHAPRRRRSSG